MTLTAIPSTPAPTAKRDAALAYAARGWPVLPLHWWQDGCCSCGDPACRTPAKHPFAPLVNRGVHDASAIANVVARWWTTEPRCNIGIRTGPESGLVLLDVDVRDAKDGRDTLRALESQLGPLPVTVSAITGSLSEHRLFEWPGADVVGSLGPGLDVKGRGGYFVAAPSDHATGRTYDWDAYAHPDDTPIAALPAAWLTRLVTRTAPATAVVPSGPPPFSPHTVAKIRSAIGVLDLDDYDTWLRVGMALHHDGHGHETAFGLWWEWSSSWGSVNPQSKKARLDELRARWRGFGRSGHQPVTLASVWQMAAARGWVAPPVPVAPVVLAPPTADAGAWDDAIALTAPGMLGTLVRWTLATAPTQVPVYALAGALATASVLCSRRYRWLGSYGSLYLLVSGPTGSGKDAVKRCVLQVLDPHPAMIGPGDFASESAVLACLRAQPQVVAVLDEFGQQLSASKGPGTHYRQGAIRQLMEAWSSCGGSLLPKALAAYGTTPGRGQPGAELSQRVVRPALTVVAMTTPDRLHGALESQHVGDGFLNRFLLLEHDGPRQPAQLTGGGMVPAAVAAWAEAVAGVGPDALPASPAVPPPVTDVASTDEAVVALHSCIAAATAAADALDATHPGVGGLWVRAGEQVARLALVAALADAAAPAEAVIDVQHVAWARRLVWWSVGRMVTMATEKLGDSPFERARSKAIDAIQRAGDEGTTRRALMRGALRALTSRDLDAVIGALDEAGLITVQQEARGQVRYRWGAPADDVGDGTE